MEELGTKELIALIVEQSAESETKYEEDELVNAKKSFLLKTAMSRQVTRSVGGGLKAAESGGERGQDVGQLLSKLVRQVETVDKEQLKLKEGVKLLENSSLETYQSFIPGFKRYVRLGGLLSPAHFMNSDVIDNLENRFEMSEREMRKLPTEEFVDKLDDLYGARKTTTMMEELARKLEALPPMARFDQVTADRYLDIFWAAVKTIPRYLEPDVFKDLVFQFASSYPCAATRSSLMGVLGGERRTCSSRREFIVIYDDWMKNEAHAVRMAINLAIAAGELMGTRAAFSAQPGELDTGYALKVEGHQKFYCYIHGFKGHNGATCTATLTPAQRKARTPTDAAGGSTEVYQKR